MAGRRVRNEEREAHRTLSCGSGELGCSADRVYEALRAAGVEIHAPGTHPPPKEITPVLVERIVSLYLAGSSAKDIGGELGLSRDRVRWVVEKRGVKRTKSEVGLLAYAHRREAASRKAKSEQGPAKSRRQWLPELEPEVLERYAAGESGEAIAPASARLTIAAAQARARRQQEQDLQVFRAARSRQDVARS